VLNRNRFVAALATLAVVGGGTTACGPFGGDTRTVSAYFEDTAGLFVGNEVGVLGIPIGDVTAIEPEGDKVKVTMVLTDDKIQVPADASALVVARSVATDRYIELAPVFHTGDTALANNGTIPITRTKTPVEWDEILAALDRFSKGLAGKDGQAGAFSNLLAVGAKALDGTGATANQTLADVAKAATALSSHRGELTGSIENLASLTQVLAANGKTIDEFASSVTAATALFDSEKEGFGKALTSLSTALNELAAFVKNNRSALKKTTIGLTDVTTDLLKHRTQLGEAIEDLPLAFSDLGRSVTKNGYVNVRLPLTDLSPLPDLTNALCAALPAGLCAAAGLDAGATLNDLLNLLGG
jgi:virulence factor Mce-like protein